MAQAARPIRPNIEEILREYRGNIVEIWREY